MNSITGMLIFFKSIQPCHFSHTFWHMMFMQRILMIDDDNDLLRLTQRALQKKGYETEGCSDWKTAIKKISTSLPNLILLDVFLNDHYDGLQICNKLKTSRFTRHIPILMMSGFPQFAEEAVAEFGAEGVMAKPFNLREMFYKVKRILSDGEKAYN